MQDNIDRIDFLNYVRLKCGNIKKYHVGSIINILIDEIIQDLKDGKNIEIYNFGEIYLKELKPRKYHDVNHDKVMWSSGAKILKFIIKPLLRKKLSRALDIDKTFGDS